MWRLTFAQAEYVEAVYVKAEVYGVSEFLEDGYVKAEVYVC